MFNTDTPAKCCSYCGARDHDFEECPKRKADAEKEEAALAPEPALVQLLAHFLHCPLSVSANRNATGKRIVQALLKLAAACVHYAGTLQAPAATPLRHLLGGTLLT